MLESRREAWRRTLLAVCLTLTAAAAPAQADTSVCSPGSDRWLPDMDGSATDFYVNGIDEGDGALYVRGPFSFAGGVMAPGIAKWDGNAWTPLPDPLGGIDQLQTLHGIPYITGHFRFPGDPPLSNRRHGFARLIEDEWEPFVGPTGGDVQSIASTSQYLYTRGTFTAVDGRPANGFARWNGKRWQALPAAPTKLFSFMEAHGETIFLLVANSGEPDMVRLFAFDGTGWSEAAPPLEGIAYDLDINENGRIYITGYLAVAGQPVRHVVAVLQDGAWVALGADPVIGKILAVGDEVFVTGRFEYIGETRCNSIARWDGTSWREMGQGLALHGYDLVYGGKALAYYQGQLYLGGAFYAVDGLALSHLARWNGDQWRPVTPPEAKGFNATVRVLLSTGDDLYAAGDFDFAGNERVDHVARWDGTSWLQVGSGLNGSVTHLTSDGSNVYAAGAFTAAGGKPANGLAKWDGVQWSPFAPQLAHDGPITAMTMHAGELWVAGTFTSTSRLAIWRDGLWHPQQDKYKGKIRGLISWNDELLVVGGIGGNSKPDSDLSRYDVEPWLRTGMGGDQNGVKSVVPRGNLLYVAAHRLLGPLQRLGVWNGEYWSPIGSSELLAFPSAVFEHAGTAFAAGPDHLFATSGGPWRTVGGAFRGGNVAESFQIALHGDHLFVAGDFVEAAGRSSGGVAAWRICPASEASCAAVATSTTTLPSAACGDANADGSITSADALVALRAAIGAVDCAGACEVTCDAAVTTADALAILRYAVGLGVQLRCQG